MAVAETKIESIERKVAEFEEQMQSSDPPFDRVPVQDRDKIMDLQITVRALGKRTHFAEMELEYLTAMMNEGGTMVSRTWWTVLSQHLCLKKKRECVFHPCEKKMIWTYHDPCWSWMGSMSSWMRNDDKLFAFDLKFGLVLEHVVIFKDFESRYGARPYQAVSYATFNKNPLVAEFRAKLEDHEGHVQADSQFATIFAWDTPKKGMKMVHLVNLWPSVFNGNILKRKHLIEAFIVFQYPDVVTAGTYV